MKKYVLILFLCYSSVLFAQQDFIVAGNSAGLFYTNPQPDITFSAVAIDENNGYGSASFDVDGDGITDFGIVAFYFTFGTGIWKGVYLNGFTSDNQAWYIHNDTVCSVFDPSQYDLVEPLEQGDTVFSNNTSSWSDLAYLGYDDETQTSPCIRGGWANNSSHYFAIRIRKNNVWYYGWVHLNVENITQLVTVYGYAIQPEVTGIANFRQSNISVFPNPVHSSFSVSEAAGMNYILYDENGRNLLEGKIDHPVQTVDASILRTGVYVLKIYDDRQSVVKRLIKF